jgi:hypothetical protein
MFGEIYEYLERNFLSPPTNISDTGERLATHYAVQDGEANEPDHTKQTGNRDAIVSILI